MNNQCYKEEVNEATVQFVGGGFGLPKTEDSLPLSAPSKRLRYGRDIKTLN
jgi:hypothetical protein